MTDTPRPKTIRNGYDVLAYWEKRAKDAEAKADLFQQDREEVVNENSALKVENERLRAALRDCREEAQQALDEDPENETLAWGNCIHIRRRADAALATTEAQPHD